MFSLSFRQGDACPNLFYHADRQIVASVHGDDFTSSGPSGALDWVEQSVKEKYEISVDPASAQGQRMQRKVVC